MPSSLTHVAKAHTPLWMRLGRSPNNFEDRPIEEINLQVNEMHVRIAGKRQPKTGLEAKFSTAYCAAIGLSGYDGMPGDFSDERLGEDRIQDLEPPGYDRNQR